MIDWKMILRTGTFVGFALAFCAGCESTEGVSGSAYYDTGFYDPWYSGHYWYDDPDLIATPPIDRPVRPTHPIARPPRPRPTPMPSIPSRPRPAMRR